MSTELQNFCAAPWSGLFYHTDSARICCAHRTFVANTSIQNFQQMKFIREVRQSFLNDEKHPTCSQCWSLEEHGMESVRKYISMQCSSVDSKSVTLDSAYTVDYLELRDGNLCNMSCIMCGPNDSSMIQTEIESHPKLKKIYGGYTNVIFNKNKISDERWAELYAIAPTLKSLMLTGGEPMLSKNFKKYLQYILDHGRDDIHLHISTNASVINETLINIFKQIKNFTMGISVDGVDATAEYHRYGCNWESVRNNIDEFIKLPADIAIGTTITAISILDISNLVKYLISLHQKNPHLNLSWRCSTNLSYTWLSGVAKERALEEIKLSRDLINNYDTPYRESLTALLNEIQIYENVLTSTAPDPKNYQKLVNEISLFDSVRTKTFESTFGFKLD